MAIDWNAVLNALTTGAKTFNTFANNPGVRTLAGLGLTGAGLAQKEEPGYAVESRQYLRNRLSPTGIADQFTGNLGPLSAGFQPYLNQLRERGIADVQQRYTAAFPKTVGAQGPEFAGISRYLTDEALPREQALLSSLGLSSLETGGQAAGKLLDYAKPDPLGEYLATLGLNLLPGQGGQAGQGATGGLNIGGLGGQAGQTGGASNALSGNVASGLQMLSQLAGQPGGFGALINNPALRAQLGAMLGTTIGFDAAMAGQGLTGVTALTSQGVAIPIEAISTGTGAGGAGLASLLGPAAAIAAGGYGIGNAIGRAVQTPTSTGESWKAGFGGAAGGAAAGAVAGTLIFPVVGTAIGAVVGAIAGGLGGLSGQHRESLQIKAANLSQDLDSQKDQVLEFGGFASQIGPQLGIPASALQVFTAQVQQLANASGGPGDEQGMAAQALGAMLRQFIPAEQWASVAPQLRSLFIEYFTRSTFTSGNSAFGGGPPANFIGVPGAGGGQVTSWPTLAGFAHGGYASRPMNAIVGERGAEMVHLEPGSYVVPFAHSLN